jgi:NAD+ kinase
MKKNKLFIKDKYDSAKYIDARGDIIIAKGGDGTLLRAINKFKHLNKPFYGIGSGTINFLMNKKEKISKNATYIKFNLIRATLSFEKNGLIVKKTFEAFNDIMIGSSASMNSWINFDLHDRENDLIFGDFKGGGLIISTAQGSTGINKNAYGAILPLNSDFWSIVGDKTNMRINHILNPQKIIVNASVRGAEIMVWIDGSSHIIHNVKDIKISKGKKVTVIFNNKKSFKQKRRV